MDRNEEMIKKIRMLEGRLERLERRGERGMRCRVSTTDATPTTMLTIPLKDNTAYLIEAWVTAMRTGGAAGSAGDSAGYLVMYGFRRTGGGGATEVPLKSLSNLLFSAEHQSAWGCVMAADGNDVDVNVTGAVDNNVSWVGVESVVEVRE